MKTGTLILAIVLALTGLAGPAAAEYKFFSPPGCFAVEVSLENPGPGRLRLPIHRNAITSLAVLGDYAIGGTSADRGLTPFIFAASLTTRNLEQAFDLGAILPDQRSVQSGFARGAEGDLYAGTMPDTEGAGGHLIRVRLAEGRLEVKDLGIAVKSEGIFALAADPGRGVLYGITHPGGKFFTHEIDGGKTTVYDQTAPDRKQQAYYHHYAWEPEDYLCRSLVLDRQGRVYGSMPINKIFRFDPESGDIEILPDELPEVWGRRPLGRVDSWALAPDGSLYGGNAGDGQLFRVDPATGKITNLGKPIMMNRLKGLAFGGDGRLYGVAGALPGYAHLFYYEPEGKGFVDLGNPDFPLHAPEIAGRLVWRGFQIATVAASEDGRYILLGEEESQSQLMIFPVK
jgi:sugar lactone lactonase YvrE